MKCVNPFLPSRERPFHIALFPDGARRWAARTGSSLTTAYEVSARIIAEFVHLAISDGVSKISVSASSAENYAREATEVQAIHDAIRYFRENYEPALLKVPGMSLRYVHGLEVSHAVSEAPNGVSPRLIVNVYTNYSACNEITRALDLLADWGRRGCNADRIVSEFASNLVEQTPVNATFRSGGFPTLGNFLPLMMGYARHYCDERLFNDIAPEQILRAVNDTMKRNVYFGGSKLEYGEIKY